MFMQLQYKQVCVYKQVCESESVSCSFMSNSLWLHDCSLPGASVHGILWARILEWFPIPFSRGLLDPGIEPGSPALQADFLHLTHQESP